MSTIRSTAWRKRGTTNDPVSFRRRRCHRHCHHCCNWRDPWHRTLALARDLSARQLILAPHTIAFAKPLNLALRVSLQKLVATATISRAREFSSIAWRSSDGCKQMFGGKEQSLGGSGRATKGHDNDRAHSRPWPMQPAGRTGRADVVMGVKMLRDRRRRHSCATTLEGRMTQKLAPCGELLEAHRRPLWDSTMERLMDNPIPIP